MKNIRILLLITLFGRFVNSLFFSGCASKYTTVKESEVRSEDGQTVHLSQEKIGKTKKPKEDFIIGFNPFKDDPDNPSPHNPLVKKFGDIPQVRTYIRLQRKYLSGQPLTINEAIDLLAAEQHLYQWQTTKVRLKYLKAHKKELEASGKLDEFEWKYTGTTSVDYTQKGYTIKTYTRPDGSKTIYDPRVEGGVIDVPPQAESPYVDAEKNDEP
ncbi:hypothetical protein C6503_20000 [Candidatus Poribacteria bacterium]|nr:MAG: hypothetical protein C6503_20000 [Candidatus Poribacteria bacterium]